MHGREGEGYQVYMSRPWPLTVVDLPPMLFSFLSMIVSIISTHFSPLIYIHSRLLEKDSNDFGGDMEDKD
jgi:hypothetical protein